MGFRLIRYSTTISLILFLYATAISYLLIDETLNLLLLGGGAILIVLNLKLFFNLNLKQWALLLLPFSMLFSGVLYFSSFRWSTILYSIFYIAVYYIFVSSLDSNKYTENKYIKTIKFILLLFFIVLIIQQLQAVLGMSLTSRLFGMRVEACGYFKYNSLTTEPSYLSTFTSFLFYSFIRMKELINGSRYKLKNFKNDIGMWFVYFYIILTCGSSFGFVYVFVFFITFLNRKTLFYVLGLILLLIVVVLNIEDFKPIERVKATYNAAITLDIAEIKNADLSSSARIVPTLVYFDNFDLFSSKTILGNGIDYAEEFIVKYGYDDGLDSLKVGFLPTYLLDYGLINFALVCFVLIANVFTRKWYWEALLLIITFTNTSFNTQMFWCVIMLLTVNKYFTDKAHTNKILAK